MTLDIRRKLLDGRAAGRNIVDTDYPTSGQVDKVEGVTWKRQKGVQKTKLVERVVPDLPEACDCMDFGVDGTVQENGN